MALLRLRQVLAEVVLRRFTQKPRRQLARPLHPDAAVAEVTVRLAEQATRGRIVQIDAEIVRELELQAAERVARPRVLAQAIGEASLAQRMPVHGRRVHLASVFLRTLEQANAVALESL